MNEQDLARRIARHLDEGMDQLPPSVLYKLRAARETALEHARESALTHLGPGLLAVRGNGRRLVGSMAGLALMLLMLYYWQSLQHQQQTAPTGELAELDAEVLTDDLPVSAYLDQGFEVWLYHHSTPASEQ
jgi:hypothetical protein